MPFNIVHSNASSIWGCSHITSAAGGGEGVWQMLTIADKGGKGQKNVQKKEIMGTENVDKENN